MPAAFHSRVLAPVALVLVLGACSDDPVDPAGMAPCRSETLAVAITGGTSPTISWRPNCRLNGLSVVHQGPATSGGAEWFIGGNGEVDGGFVSPVRYAVVPAGGRQVSPPRPLVAGTTYRVLLGYTPPQPEPWTFDAVANPFTVCGRAVGGCATDGMEYFGGPSPEGLRFEVITARPSTARGDTARFLARVTNPGASAAWWRGCGAAFLVLQRPGARLDLAVSPCALGDSISLAPSASREYEVRVTGLVAMGAGRYGCIPAGSWNVAFGTLLWDGGRRIGSAPVSWTLVERPPSDGACIES